VSCSDCKSCVAGAEVKAVSLDAIAFLRHGRGRGSPALWRVAEPQSQQRERYRLGRKAGYRPSDKHIKKVLELAKDGLSYRLIGRNLGLSKNTMMQIVQRLQVIADEAAAA